MTIFRGYPIYTLHGFLVDGVYSTEFMPQPKRARCGGPRLCGKCNQDVTTKVSQAIYNNEVLKEGTKVNEEQAARETEKTPPELEEALKDFSGEPFIHNGCLGPDVCAKCRAEAEKRGWKGYQSEKFPDTARRLVYEYISNVQYPKSSAGVDLKLDDIYVVFFTYTLGNWKAMVSTRAFDGLYYEVTHNDASSETYLDAYQKINNVVITDHTIPTL
jgi:hypothetical protein